MKIKTQIMPYMKKMFMLSLFAVVALNFAYAQDIITLKNGDEIKAKVNEIDLQVIKYKKFENQNGPIYSIDKEKVFMIKYENGTKDLFNETLVTPVKEPVQKTEMAVAKTTETAVTKTVDGDKLTCSGGRVLKDSRKLKPFEVKNIMVSNTSALNKYKSSRTFNALGWIFISASFIELATGLAQTTNDMDGTTSYILAAINGGFGLAFSLISSSQLEKSVNIYNSDIKNQSLKLGISPTGLGFCYNF